MKLRLFVAVELSEPVRAFAERAANLLAASGVMGRFELREKLHVTVAFLGYTPESELAAAVHALRETSGACRPFRLDFEQLGAFPNERRPRVLWVGPKLANADFTSCATRVREAYALLGYHFEQDAHPHITICRPKRVPPKPLPQLPGHAALSVDGLTLFQSIPAGPTTRYEALERSKFGASARVMDSLNR